MLQPPNKVSFASGSSQDKGVFLATSVSGLLIMDLNLHQFSVNTSFMTVSTIVIDAIQIKLNWMLWTESISLKTTARLVKTWHFLQMIWSSICLDKPKVVNSLQCGSNTRGYCNCCGTLNGEEAACAFFSHWVMFCLFLVSVCLSLLELSSWTCSACNR